MTLGTFLTFLTFLTQKLCFSAPGGYPLAGPGNPVLHSPRAPRIAGTVGTPIMAYRPSTFPQADDAPRTSGRRA
jgi:hypothetical protein